MIRVRTNLEKPENLEKWLFLKKLRETQGNSGKVLKNHANSGKTQGIFSALHQQKKLCIKFEAVLMYHCLNRYEKFKITNE